MDNCSNSRANTRRSLSDSAEGVRLLGLKSTLIVSGNLRASGVLMSHDKEHIGVLYPDNPSMRLTYQL